MKFLHTSDWHVGGSKALKDDALPRQMGVLDAIVDIALARGIKTIVMAGDVFDVDTPSEIEQMAFLERVLAYDRAGLRLLVIRGNHDHGSMEGRTAIRYLAHMTDHDVFRNSVFTEVTRFVRVDDTVFVLLCHRPRYFQEDVSDALAKLRTSSLAVECKHVVMVCHETIQGSLTDTNHRLSDGAVIPLSTGETIPEFDVTYWAVGDIHQCFPGEVQVMIDYDKCASIYDVVNNDTITHVLSYNLAEKRIEKKRVVCKRESDFTGKYVRISLEDGSAIKSTNDHKYVVVGRGEVAAKDVVAGDRLIQYAGAFERTHSCSKCGEVSRTLRAHKVHVLTHDSRETITCKACNRTFNTRAEKGGHVASCTPELVRKQNLVKCSVCGLMFKEKNIGAHMFFHDEQRVADRSFASSTALRRFYQTPEGVANREEKRRVWIALEPWKLAQKLPRIGTMSKGERVVNTFGITDLTFTGLGHFWVTLTDAHGTQRHKNPDFVLGDPKNRSAITKVVEVFGGMGYFHSETEMVTLVAEYKTVGIDALIIDDRRMSTHEGRAEVRAELEAFCNNHYVTVANVHEYVRSTKTVNKVYSVEVEGNHNFFAITGTYSEYGSVKSLSTPVLVKNCQRVAPRAFYCGAPLQIHFGDADPKGVFLVDTDNPDNPEFVAVDSKRLVRLHLHDGVDPVYPENAHVKLVGTLSAAAKAREAGMLTDAVVRVEVVREDAIIDYQNSMGFPDRIRTGLSQLLAGDDLDLALKEANVLFAQAGVSS